MPAAHLWHLWPGRHWPFLKEEEADFVAELVHMSQGTRPKFERGHLTSLVNALRCGTGVRSLLAAAPGLDVDTLLVSYEHLEARRAESVAAWAAIVAEPTISTVAEHGHLAARILPKAARQVIRFAHDVDEDLLGWAANEAYGLMSQLSAQSLDIENQLRACTPPSLEGVRLGRLLYDPYDPQLWGDPFYLPDRVGTLVPPRIADLLGEN